MATLLCFFKITWKIEGEAQPGVRQLCEAADYLMVSVHTSPAHAFMSFVHKNHAFAEAAKA